MKRFIVSVCLSQMSDLCRLEAFCTCIRLMNDSIKERGAWQVLRAQKLKLSLKIGKVQTFCRHTSMSNPHASIRRHSKEDASFGHQSVPRSPK